MSHSTHLVAIVLMAVMTITVLTIGTLAAAGMLPRRRARVRQDAGRSVEGET